MTKTSHLRDAHAVAALTAALLGTCCFCASTCYRGTERSHDLRNPLLTPAIEMRADDEGLKDLRFVVVKDSDIEARIWMEPTMVLDAAEGFVITRISDTWSARHLLPREHGASILTTGHRVVVSPWTQASGGDPAGYVEPLSGWASLWESLTEAGLLTLPDESLLPLMTNKHTPEGAIHVVELRTSREYKAYRYTNPEQYNTPETKGMVRIVRILHDEFLKDRQEQ